MFRQIIVLIAIVVPSSSLTLVSESPNEFIRQKLENATLTDVVCLGDKVLCLKSVRQVYTQNAFEILWNQKNIDELTSTLEAAVNEGLNPSDYHISTIKEHQKLGVLSATMQASLDIICTDAFLLYSSHLLSGKTNANTIENQWFVTKTEDDPLFIFEKAIVDNNIKESLNSCLPKHLVYEVLKMALKKYNKIDQKNWPKISLSKTLKLGDENESIKLIKERLTYLGDLNSSEKVQSNLFDDELLAALIQFQKRHGLEADGAIGPNTALALNISLTDRINQIKANLERWRWLPKEFGNYYIKVNIADYKMLIMKNGVEVETHKIIVGKTYRKTPVLASKMTYLVLNPTWTVPPGIIRNDIIPAMKKDINYLTNKKIELLSANGTVVDPKTVDWNSSAALNYTYRQPAGKDNALGAVKFIFPNPYFIYLHDTPSRDLFDKTERAFSSGCVRVNNPLLLAEYLLNDQKKWSIDAIKKVVASNITQTVMLKEQPDVYILYWTAWVEANQIQFRKDIYERDAAIITKLAESPKAQKI